MLDRPLYYLLDEQGNPYPTDDSHAANQLLAEAEKRRVARFEKTVSDHEICVSTVFLVIDHGFSYTADGCEPVLFETMLFVDDKAIGNATRRYSTKDEAQRGHNEVVEVMKQVIEELGKQTVTSAILSKLLTELPE